ncbi:hypothetical protein EYZ11_009403 [Aspergillus tanneri]|uniref:Uncharacterized protein n=1 Tax=Aspergillus tanneri TaxID=1220188 RepID=A0A4S3J7Y9_9EURO|nr:hypothetical protein EYZ11_009403 [Aspergillus tanneri]
MALTIQSSILFPTTLKACSMFAMLTGSMDVIFGADMITSAAGPLPLGSPAITLLDSQIRYLGAMWAGYGVMLWWTSNDLQTRKAPLDLLAGIMFVGGIGRLVSGMRAGGYVYALLVKIVLLI